MEDDSGSHVLELGWARVTNLLPNTFYQNLLTIQGFDQQPEQQMALRILCKFKAPGKTNLDYRITALFVFS